MINNLVGGVPDQDDLGLVADFVGKLRNQPGFREQAFMFLQGKNPFTPEVLERAARPFGQLEKKLSKIFCKSIIVDAYPTEFTPEFLANAAQYNLKPVFLPGEEIAADRRLKRWTKPEEWFYRQVTSGKIKPYGELTPTQLRGGWYLADFTVGVDYTNGGQVLANDPWASLITRLREGKDTNGDTVGKYDNTPLGSRFAITPEEWDKTVLPYMASALLVPRANIRLERAIEFNAIGNLYDPNRGKFNMWQWFADHFGDSRRLYGGGRVSGGLAFVYYDWSVSRSGNVVARPLVSFVS